MKTIEMRYLIIAFFIFIIGVDLLDAQSAIPNSNYGVWNRGADQRFVPTDPKFDYLLGITTTATWETIQPNNSTDFEWGEVQQAIDFAFTTNQILTIKINVGPQSPDWIYDTGDVTLVKTFGHKFDSFPHYADPDYINHYYNMIDSFATFIYDQPQDKQDLLSFIFPQNGATGDEVAYKGTFVPGFEIYDLLDPEWTTFRINSWNHWKSAFRDGKTRPIPFLFNELFIGSTEWLWVLNNIVLSTTIGDDFGIKNFNAYSRGHHLTNEKEFYDTYRSLLVDPPALELFNRAEMDQSWTKPLYDINTELGFYWGAVSGLNTGLSIWDVTTSALEFAETNRSVQESFRFFSKYAGQIDPATSKKAFIVLHEGLNSSDTNKFPVSTYGDATRLNLARYAAICNDPIYANRGAAMDDLDAASDGQVAQRDTQTGYNDSGWDIWPTNYARFINQLDPEAESIGLFRIGGKIDSTSSIYSRFARAFENSTGRDTMFFQMDPNFFSSAADTVKISVVYYDSIVGSTWQFQYDAGMGNFKTTETVTCTGSKTWKAKDIIVTDAVMQNNGPQASDFALVNSDNLDDIFHRIEIEQLDGNYSDNVSITYPNDGDEFYLGDAVAVLAEGCDFQGIASMRFQIDNGPFMEESTNPYEHVYSNLGLGNHTLLVQMLDNSGNTLNSQVVNITVLEIPLVDYVSITSPTNGQTFLSGSDITVIAEGFDNEGIEFMRFKVNDGGFINENVVPYTHVFAGLADGEHELVVQMKDFPENRILSEIVTIYINDGSGCPDDLVLFNSQNTTAAYEVGTIITSSQIITSSTDVVYDAGETITLLPDFAVEIGSTFHAFIDGCVQVPKGAVNSPAVLDSLDLLLQPTLLPK